MLYLATQIHNTFNFSMYDLDRLIKQIHVSHLKYTEITDSTETFEMKLRYYVNIELTKDIR